jgi:glycine/D-amino acid oxidase-like deaminating enzyme
LHALLPGTRDVAITHRWGGPLGLPRDWHPSVGLDRRAGLAWAGGYVGDGVGTANLAGRTMADLVLNRDTELTRLPWVGHCSRRWEPEPLRWLGANALRWVASSADAAETRAGRPARRATLLDRVLHG